MSDDLPPTASAPIAPISAQPPKDALYLFGAAPLALLAGCVAAATYIPSGSPASTLVTSVAQGLMQLAALTGAFYFGSSFRARSAVDG